MLRVAAFAETDRGGAGLSALKLNLALRKLGIDARLYVNRKTSPEPSVSQIPTKPARAGAEFRVGQYKSQDGQLPLTTGLSVKDPFALESIWQWADCILLRWVSTVVPDWLIGMWSARPKPVVWCLSDMAPLTGGCHYSMGCDQYELGCNACPMAPPSLQFLPRAVHERRRRIWKDLTIVSPSQWLATVALNSGITKNKRIRVIPTGVELDIFKPLFPASALPNPPRLDQKIIYFGAGSLSDPRKGGKYLTQIVNILNNHMGMRGTYTIVAPGHNSGALDGVDCRIRTLGHIDDRNELAYLKASADVTVLPYIEDNLPNVALESLACGTPVCAFAIGGLRDVVVDDVNGHLAKPFDVWELSCKVAKILERPLERSSIRSWAESHIDVRDQARAYSRLFAELSSTAKPVPSHNLVVRDAPPAESGRHHRAPNEPASNAD